MPAIYLQTGDTLDHIPATDLPLGAVVVLADTVAIATRPIPAGTLGALALTGVFELPRQAGAAIPQGARVAWDPAAGRVVTDLALAGAKPLGIAAAAAGDTATTVRVRLG